jgi:hypothetical protein
MKTVEQIQNRRINEDIECEKISLIHSVSFKYLVITFLISADHIMVAVKERRHEEKQRKEELAPRIMSN